MFVHGYRISFDQVLKDDLLKYISDNYKYDSLFCAACFLYHNFYNDKYISIAEFCKIFINKYDYLLSVMSPQHNLLFGYLRYYVTVGNTYHCPE